MQSTHLMKKLYTLALAVALAASSAPVYGAVPFAKGKTAPRVSRHEAPLRAATASTLVDEDFSRFTEGAEDNPATEITYVNGYHVPDELTAQPGWTSQGLRPAGGCVALYGWQDSYGDTRGGYLSTPPLDLGGTATLTFKAKRPAGSEASIWVALCDDYNGPGDDQGDYELTEEWQTFTLVAKNGSLDEPSYFQITAEDGIAFLDDVRIDFVRDRIATPSANPAKNVSPTEFVASWEDTGAPQYRLNVYYTEHLSNPATGTASTDFDGIKVNADGKIDTAAPNYPEGWYINVSEAGTKDTETSDGNYHSSPLALVIDEIGDTITTPVLPYPADGLSFWVKPSSTADDDYEMSLLRVETCNADGEWSAIAQLPHYYMDEDGGFYTVDSDALGKNVMQIRFSMIQKGKVTFYIDDIEVHYTQQGENVAVVKDYLTSETEYTVKDIIAANDYYYYVEAIDGDVVSGKSYPVWVDGITGLQVETLPASNITATGFTANWQPLGHATNYSVALNRVTTAKEDMKDVLVLEENFDAITEGTVDNPGTDWISPYDFGANGKANTGWCATQPAWAKGMAGSTGTNYWMGTAGLVYSPMLDLNGNGGEGFNVEATVVTTVDKFVLQDNTEETEGVFVMVLKSPYDQQAITAALIETPTVGSTHAKVTVLNPDKADLSNVMVTFMTKSGAMFFVDDVKITQDLKAGEVLKTPYTSVSTNDTWYTFTNLSNESEYGYSVTASTRHEYVDYVSVPTDVETVALSGTTGVEEIAKSDVTVSGGEGVIAVTAADADAVSIYTLQGFCAGTATGSATFNVPAGMYIVKAGDKTFKVAVK